MKDETFIEEVLKKGRDAKTKANYEFSVLSVEQLNFKPSEQSWSIAQCLEHLINSHNSYFPHLQKITGGSYKMNSWERNSPFTGFFGKLFKDQMQEKVKRKLKAPKKIRPSKSNFTHDIIEDYNKNLDRFIAYIEKSRQLDLDKIIITSPFIKIITYSLKDVYQFLVAHEHRHLNQGIRIKSNENFPGK